VTWLHALLHFLGNSQLFCAFTIENIQGSFEEIQGSFAEIHGSFAEIQGTFVGLPEVPERLCDVATCPAALSRKFTALLCVYY